VVALRPGHLQCFTTSRPLHRRPSGGGKTTFLRCIAALPISPAAIAGRLQVGCGTHRNASVPWCSSISPSALEELLLQRPPLALCHAALARPRHQAASADLIGGGAASQASRSLSYQLFRRDASSRRTVRALAIIPSLMRGLSLRPLDRDARNPAEHCCASFSA